MISPVNVNDKIMDTVASDEIFLPSENIDLLPSPNLASDTLETIQEVCNVEVHSDELGFVIQKRKKSKSSNSACSSPSTTGSARSQYKLKKDRWSISKNNLSKNRKLGVFKKSRAGDEKSASNNYTKSWQETSST